MSVTSEGDISGFVSENDNLSFGTTTYAYNVLNQLTSENSPAGMSTYAYDKNGNLTSISGAKAVQYSYDEYGRLKSVSVTTNGANEKESYTYDAEGNRISRTTKGGTVYYVNDACADLTQVIAETDGNGTLKKEYTRGLSVISATNGAAETSYFVNDGQGNIRAIVYGGVVADTYRYDAYGNLIEKTGDSDNDLLYNGEQYSEATGLYYLRARYMDPTTGRFISMDAYSGELGNPTSLHKYLYANANPVMYCDPSGYTSMPEALTSMAIQSAIGALIGANLAAFYCWANPELKKEDALQILWDGIKMGALFGASFGLLDGLPGVIAATKFASYAPMAYGICIGVEAGFAAYGVIDSAKGIVEAFQKRSVRLGIFYVVTGGLSVYALGKLAGREYGLGENGTGNTNASQEYGNLSRRQQAEQKLAQAAQGSRSNEVLLGKDGDVPVYQSQAQLKNSLVGAGAKYVGPTRNNDGQIYHMDTPYGPVEIRIMQQQPGQTNPYLDNRTIIVEQGSVGNGTGTYTYGNGAPIRGAVLRGVRKAIGHTHNQTP